MNSGLALFLYRTFRSAAESLAAGDVAIVN